MPLKSVSRKTWPIAMDLFCGCGGLTLGLKQAQFRVVGAVDNDALAVRTYKLNHRSTHVWKRDIRKLTVAEVRRKLDLRPGQLDLLAGCPPCQGFSSIRTRNRAHQVPDERNELVLQFVRFVRGLKPRAVMLENVPGLASDGRFDELRDELARLGYETRYEIRNVADFGVPQRRRRLILLAGQGQHLPLPDPIDVRLTVGDCLGGLSRPGKSGDPLHDLPEQRSDRIKMMIRSIPRNGGSRAALGAEAQLACHQKLTGFHDIYGRMSWNDVAPTITGGCVNPSKGRFLHPRQNRAITLREAALLQSFPPAYRFALDQGKYATAAMIGNALPPEFVRVHARELRPGLVGRARHLAVT